MSWMYPFFGGSDQQQTQPNLNEIGTKSWYPPSVITPSPQNSTENTSKFGAIQSTLSGMEFTTETKSAGIITLLKGKSVDELRKVLADKDEYSAFFNSLEIVKNQNNLHNELLKETLELARANLEKEPTLLELRNQCTIIRTSELASARERLDELERKKDEIVNSLSPRGLLEKLQESVDKTDEESESLNKKLLNEEVDLRTFVQKCKTLRTIHHKRTLLHLSARTSVF